LSSYLDKEESTPFNRFSDPRYIGLYKVPRPVESNDEDWWKQCEMAAGERQAGSQLMVGSPPHYVNENPEDNVDNRMATACESKDVLMSEAEAPDYVNATAADAPYDSLEKAPSLTKFNDDNSMGYYVKPDTYSHLATAQVISDEVQSQEISLSRKKSLSPSGVINNSMDKEGTVCPQSALADGEPGNSENVNGIKMTSKCLDALVNCNTTDLALDVHVDTSNVGEDLSGCEEGNDLGKSELPVKEYVVVTVHDSDDEGETSC
jgi:hypothetical protein